MLVPWRSLNVSHKRTSQCKKGVKRKQRRLAEEEEMMATTGSVSAYGRTLEMVLSFKYLGRLLLVSYDDWLAVIRNLIKSRAVWWRMIRILIREGLRPQVSKFSSNLSYSWCCSSVRRREWLPLYGTGTGVFPGPVGAATATDTATVEVGREMGVHLGGGG